MIRPTLAALLLLGLAAPATRADDAKPMNVLLLFADDLRCELGCYGTPGVKTPNIDGLATAGVRFDRAYCQYPLCNPSRTSIMTGRYLRSTGVFDNTTYFRDAHPDWVTLPQFFTKHGYPALRTGKIFHGTIDDTGSWTEGGTPRAVPEKGLTKAQKKAKAQAKTKAQREGSDRIVVLQGNGESHQDYRTATQAIDYLQRYKDKPFFLAVGFTKPHSPPTALKRFFDMYDPATIPLPADFAPRPTVPEGFPKRSVPAQNGDLFIGRDASPEAAREMKRAYWASLTWTDWNVGRVLDELDRLKLRDNTVIVFWGDHGYHLGEKGKWSKHQSLFEVGARVPFIIAAPGAKGNGRPCPRVVESVDLYPTLAVLCKLPRPEGVDGDSLAPLLQDPEARWDHPAFTSGGKAEDQAISVRTERYRYTEWDGGKDGAVLFDENADPHETKNLINDPKYADVRAELSALVKRHVAGDDSPSKPAK